MHGIKSLTHKSQKIAVHHICQWQQHHDHLDPSTKTSESHRERMKITGSSLNQMHECIVPILQIWIWNIESTRSMIGLIWVDFARLRGSFYTSGIRLHQLHLVARWITLENIAWQSCERNKSSNSQLFNWYELHWIALFAMIYFQHRGFLGARVNARVAYFKRAFEVTFSCIRKNAAAQEIRDPRKRTSCGCIILSWKNPTHPFLSLSFWAARRGKKNKRFHQMSGWAKFQKAETSYKVVVIWTPMWKKTRGIRHTWNIMKLSRTSSWRMGESYVPLCTKNRFASVYITLLFDSKKSLQNWLGAPWATKLGSSAHGNWCNQVNIQEVGHL